MIKPIRFLSLLILFFLLSTYSPTYKNDNVSFIFPIKEIKIENNKAIDSKRLLNELEIIKGKSLMLVDKEILKSVINQFDFVSNFQIKKIYPKTIKVIIFEKKPIVIHIEKKNKFYISDKGDLIKYTELDNYSNLPLLFGEKTNFTNFFEDLKSINFPTDNIKSFHYFEVGRWDIKLKDERVIKLPEYNYIDMLENFILIKGDKNFDKYRIFDYRIKDQLVLN